MKKIRVLVVDDSMVFREILSRGLSTEPGIEVIATANDPFDARDKILKYKPDVMTCDVEMPRMNGIEFDAMRSGAVDFVAKPDVNSVDGVEQFIIDIIEKVKIASKAKVQQGICNINTIKVDNKILDEPSSNTIIAIGASTGGTEAIYQILKALPVKVPGHCPSVDVLFESVAKEAGKDSIGIILTGMGYDGARGLLAMKRKGARTIGQDEKSSVVYGMPKVAYDLGAVDKQTSIENIGTTLMNML